MNNHVLESGLDRDFATLFSSDQTLLAKAAAVAGLTGEWLDAGLNIGSSALPVIWNPLRDDGDALRLVTQMKLGLKVETYRSSVFTNDGLTCTEEATMGYSIEEATRRAIARLVATM